MRSDERGAGGRRAGRGAALPDAEDPVAHRVRSADFARFRATVRSVQGCAKPVWLVGSWSVVGSDGAGLAEHAGSVAVVCNNRRASVCETCSARYAGDAYQLIKAGLSGGKGVPAGVGGHPRLFVTLTAPSFGAVHQRSITALGRLRRCACGETHAEYDPRIGTPLDPASYDYVGAVLWHHHAGQLWHRFRMRLSRLVARSLGIRVKDIREVFRLSYSKVAEYQRRGMVHFHAVVRLDGPEGPGTAPPAAVTPEVLSELIRTAAGSVSVTPDPGLPPRVLVWGEQLDIESIAATVSDDAEQVLRERQVAGYIAKYATKGTGATSGTDSRIRSAHHIDQLPVSEHHRAMIRTCWELGLRRWAHMLGFGGHFLTKSKFYSTTFTTLRQTRATHQRAAHLERLGIVDPEGITVVNQWDFAGVGWRSEAERELAVVIGHSSRRAQQTFREAQAEIDQVGKGES